jgi:hypothetical protein
MREKNNRYNINDENSLEDILDPNSTQWSQLRHTTMQLITTHVKSYESSKTLVHLSKKRKSFALELTQVLNLSYSSCRQYLNKLAGNIKFTYNKKYSLNEYYGPTMINGCLPLLNLYGISIQRSLEKLSLLLNYINIDETDQSVVNLRTLYPDHFEFPPNTIQSNLLSNKQTISQMVFADELSSQIKE